MTAFRADDFSHDGLKRIGTDLGIPNAATLKRDDLAAEIRKLIASGDVLFMTQLVPVEKPKPLLKRLGFWSLLVSVVAALFAGCAMLFRARPGTSSR